MADGCLSSRMNYVIFCIWAFEHLSLTFKSHITHVAYVKNMTYKYSFPGLILAIHFTIFVFYSHSQSRNVKNPKIKSDFYSEQNSSDLSQRTENMLHFCQALPKPYLPKIKARNEDLLTKNIVHISGLGINWCMVPKVASGSMSRMILPFLKKLDEEREFPYTHLEVWTRAGHTSYADFMKQSDDKMPAFLITRHPFARVVSAYKNKLEDKSKFQDGQEFFWSWSKQIIK